MFNFNWIESCWQIGKESQNNVNLLPKVKWIKFTKSNVKKWSEKSFAKIIEIWIFFVRLHFAKIISLFSFSINCIEMLKFSRPFFLCTRKKFRIILSLFASIHDLISFCFNEKKSNCFVENEMEMFCLYQFYSVMNVNFIISSLIGCSSWCFSLYNQYCCCCFCL